MSQSTIERTFRVHFLILPDDGGYSALCYEFNVAACGETRQEAERNLAGAVNDYLGYLADEARLDKAYRPASNDLLLEFLGLDPEWPRAHDLSETIARSWLEAQEAPTDPVRDATLECVPRKGPQFTAPALAMKSGGLLYAVRVAVYGR